MAKSRSLIGPIITLIVVAALGYGGWYFYNKSASKEPEFTTVKVTRGSLQQTITATGTLQTTAQVTISSQVSGNVIAINADFNDHVQKDQWLLKIDPTTYEQKLRQAEADYAATQASTEKVREDFKRSEELFKGNLLSQADYAASKVQLAQAESSLIGRSAAVENAKTDLQRCTIYSPIEGEVLNRTTDVGGTVNVNQSAVALYTIINDLTKLQISADVSESDIGTVQEGQIVNFQVDAYLNRPFQGKVTQVRNFARNTSGVVTFSVIIEVDNSARLLKPGMTATANILITERTNVLKIPNTALRVRIPPELQEKMGDVAPVVGSAAPSAAPAPAATEPTAPAAPEDNTVAAATPGGDQPAAADGAAAAGTGRRGGRRNGGAGGGGGRRGMMAGSGQNTGAGMNVSSQPRRVYKLVTDAKGKKMPQPVMVILGISDGAETQIVDGLNEGDTLVTYITMPGAAAAVITAPTGPTGSPFQQGGRGAGLGGGGFGGGGGGGGRGGF